MVTKAWLVVGASAALLVACSDPPAPQPTVPVPTYPTPTSPPTTETPTPTLTPPSASPTATRPDGLKTSGGFLSLRYDCTFTADSFQGKWVEQGRKEPDFGVPDKTERYSSDVSGGRADLIFGKAFNAGVGSKDPVRVKAKLVADGRVTIWVTKPHPSPKLDVNAAAAATLDDLAAMMSSTRTGEEGSCTVKPAQPLPPQYTGTPDDR